MTKIKIFPYRLFSGRFSIFLCFVFLFLSGCTPVSTEGIRKDMPAPEQTVGTPLRILTIGTADSGGTMYPVGSAIARAISSQDPLLKVNVSASAGSFTNVKNILDGQADLGLVSGDVAFSAYFGTDTYSGNPQTELRAIGAVHPSLSNWMASDSSGLTYVHQLAGHKAAIGPQESTTDLSARIALHTAGLNAENMELHNLSLAAGSRQVEEGQLDVVHGFAGIPISSLTELSARIPCHLLKYTDEELDAILSDSSFYYPAVIPAGTYPGQTEDVSTFGIKCLLCVDASMDKKLVYRLTRILDETRPQLITMHPALSALDQASFMCDQLPIPLHPGAESYYMEKGYLNP